MAEKGAIPSLISLLDSPHESILRQAAKALANLGVNSENKTLIAGSGGIPKLIILARSTVIAVRIEAVAALANLAVNDNNEIEIVKCNGLDPIINGCIVAAGNINTNNTHTTIIIYHFFDYTFI